MCFSTAASRLASEFAVVEFAVVELDVATDARGLGDDGSEVCAMALPNTNVDTRTAAITFIKVSVGGYALLRGIRTRLIAEPPILDDHGNVMQCHKKQDQGAISHSDSPTKRG